MFSSNNLRNYVITLQVQAIKPLPVHSSYLHDSNLKNSSEELIFTDQPSYLTFFHLEYIILSKLMNGLAWQRIIFVFDVCSKSSQIKVCVSWKPRHGSGYDGGRCQLSMLNIINQTFLLTPNKIIIPGWDRLPPARRPSPCNWTPAIITIGG